MPNFQHLSAKVDDTFINAVIEIPLNSKAKIEYRIDREIFEIDRFLYPAFSYPFNYGFIPGTWSEDEDPIDIVVISSEPVSTGLIIQVKIIGALITEDEEGIDPKLIAVPKGKVDPMFKDVNSVDDLPVITKDRIKHFYETYKTIEPGKWVKVSGWQSKAEADKTVIEGIAKYEQKFNKSK